VTGLLFAVERGRLPRAVTWALVRAADIGDGRRVPCAALVEAGAEPIAVLPLRALVRLCAKEAER
jgi:hypothetical protein